MDVVVRMMLKDDLGQPFMGIGVVWLLKGVQEHCSVSQAAREMKLSYPKALKMIQNLESVLGREVVRRHKGGHTRGGAELTPDGQEFLRCFQNMLDEVQDQATRSFSKNFSHFLHKENDRPGTAPLSSKETSETDSAKGAST